MGTPLVTLVGGAFRKGYQGKAKSNQPEEGPGAAGAAGGRGLGAEPDRTYRQGAILQAQRAYGGVYSALAEEYTPLSCQQAHNCHPSRRV